MKYNGKSALGDIKEVFIKEVSSFQTILNKLQMQLEVGNVEAAKVLISHCIEKLNNGERLCDIK